MASSTIALNLNKNVKQKKRGNVAVSSSQTNAAEGLQVPPQNTTNTQEEVSKNFCWESFSKIQFPIYSIGFDLAADQNLYPHTEMHTRLWAQQETLPAKAGWKASQSYHLYFGVYRSQYTVPPTTLREVYKAKTTSIVNLFFFFFLRGVRIDDTAFENCSCLATWFTCVDSKIKKRRKKRRDFS